MAKTYASETLLATVILHQNETQWVIPMLWFCFARDLLLELQLQREFTLFTGCNADAVTKQIWSELPFYCLQIYMYICKAAIPPHKAWFLESFSVQSMAHSFSWFFLIAKTSYRATPGYSQTTRKNKAVWKSSWRSTAAPVTWYNANSEPPSKRDESCTFPTLTAFFFCGLSRRKKSPSKFLELRNSLGSWSLWSSKQHQHFILLFTSFAETIKLTCEYSYWSSVWIQAFFFSSDWSHCYEKQQWKTEHV